MEGSSPQQRVQEGPSTPSRGLTTTFCPQKMAIPELASRQEIQGDLQQAFLTGIFHYREAQAHLARLSALKPLLETSSFWASTSALLAVRRQETTRTTA